MTDRDPTAPLGVFPFVVGCPRSGTTLLQALLHSHPELAVPPESHFIPRVARAFGGGWHGLVKAERFADVLFKGRRFERWEISREQVIGLLEQHRPDDVAAAIRLLFATWAERAGRPRYADKTPRYVSHIDRISALLPESRFIHLIRDGRDVALSLAAAFDRAPQTGAQAALYWASRVGEGRSQGLRLGPGRYLEVRYEALLASPEEVLREVCEFIDLRFYPAMLDHRRGAAEVIAGYPEPGVHDKLAGPIEAHRDWRLAMPDRERRNFELFAGELLAELGYETGAVEEGTDLEAERRRVLASELDELRHSRFRAERKAARRAELLRRRRNSPWARLAARATRPVRALPGRLRR